MFYIHLYDDLTDFVEKPRNDVLCHKHLFPETMRVTIDVNDNEWGFLSALLKRFDFVRIQRVDETKAELVAKKLTFNATQLDTIGFSFNREEANER